MDAVFARESESGWAGKEGILIYSAAGFESEFTPETLLKAVQDWQDMYRAGLAQRRIREDSQDNSRRLRTVSRGTQVTQVYINSRRVTRLSGYFLQSIRHYHKQLFRKLILYSIAHKTLF